MTAIEMEDAIKSIDTRLQRMEQILPTLATKDDLKAAFDGANRYAEKLAADAANLARLLHEDLKDTIKTIGKGSSRKRRT